MEPHSRRVDESFSEARLLTEISLLPDKIRVASGRRAVAMATGVIDRYYKDGTPQKQVLVVVTSGWSVLCFDHNLNKLWETNLQVFIFFLLCLTFRIKVSVILILLLLTFVGGMTGGFPT